MPAPTLASARTQTQTKARVALLGTLLTTSPATLLAASPALADTFVMLDSQGDLPSPSDVHSRVDEAIAVYLHAQGHTLITREQRRQRLPQSASPTTNHPPDQPSPEDECDPNCVPQWLQALNAQGAFTYSLWKQEPSGQSTPDPEAPTLLNLALTLVTAKNQTFSAAMPDSEYLQHPETQVPQLLEQTFASYTNPGPRLQILNLPPGTQVLIDNTLAGSAPFNRKIPPGTRNIQLQPPNAPIQNFTLQIPNNPTHIEQYNYIPTELLASQEQTPGNKPRVNPWNYVVGAAFAGASGILLWTSLNTALRAGECVRDCNTPSDANREIQFNGIAAGVLIGGLSSALASYFFLAKKPIKARATVDKGYAGLLVEGSF